jgi:hypothetical protein
MTATVLVQIISTGGYHFHLDFSGDSVHGPDGLIIWTIAIAVPDGLIISTIAIAVLDGLIIWTIDIAVLDGLIIWTIAHHHLIET